MTPISYYYTSSAGNPIVAEWRCVMQDGKVIYVQVVP